MNKFIRSHKTLIGLIGALSAFVIATVYYFVVPDELASAESGMRILLSYGHSASWVLLGVAILLWGFGRSGRATRLFAYAALISYLAFFGALLLSGAS